MPAVRPTFTEMMKHYPSANDGIDRPSLFKSIGWDREIDNLAFLDTCAIRGSIALIGCGVPVKGRVPILKGPYKGKWIEPGQAKLTLWLAKYWGEPEKYKTNEIRKLAGRCGVISHFNIRADTRQGHFDILKPNAGAAMECAGHCWWTSLENWFWELPR